MTQDQPSEADSVGAVVPEALEALSAAVARGHHLALVSAEGAGVEALYAAAVIRDLAETDGGGRAFVLTASTDRAQRCAHGMYSMASAAGLSVLVATAEALSVLEDAGGAEILIGTPALLLQEVRAGRLSAATLRTLILDDVRALESAWPAVEAILQACDQGARRIASTHARDPSFDDLVTHWLPRARRWPSEWFDAAPPETEPGAVPIEVGTGATGPGRLSRLTHLLHGLARSDELDGVSIETAPSAVPVVQAALSVAGFQLSAAEEEEGVRVGAWGLVHPAVSAIVFGLPRTAEDLARSFGAAKKRFAIVDPLHERQLDLMARRLGWRVVPVREASDAELADEVEAFRARVVDALARQDLATGALLLGPLLEEHGAARVAAALAGMLRDSDLATPTAQSPAGSHRDSRTQRSGMDPTTERVTRPTWTRVFVGVGKRDGAAPGDLLGAITGETAVAGGQIGRIDIRQGFTLVDVDSLVADDVVRGLDGSRIKGRQVVAHLDRDRRR